MSLVLMLCRDLNLCLVDLLGNRGRTIISPRVVERIEGGDVKLMGQIAWRGIGAWEMGAMIRIFGRVFLTELLLLLYFVVSSLLLQDSSTHKL